MLDLLSNLTDFHFIRPLWFLGLIPAATILLLYHLKKRSVGKWADVINPALLPFLMQDNIDKKGFGSGWMIAGLGLTWLLTCTSLAGPTWQQLPQPVHKADSALVVVFDLSPSMLAGDISPSRLVRARYKLIDILNTRREGFVGLVVYGGEAHTVSPLTEDSNTIISLVPNLHPTLLPAYGSNVEDAIDMALSLAINGGYVQADILLISDGVARSAFGTIQTAVAQSGEFRLSILGIGTAQGAPIPLGNGGFVKDQNGAIVIPKLDSVSLQILARNSGGQYRSISNDDSDVEQLLAATEQLFPDATRELDRSFDLWDDQGYWLAILLIPALILSFRRGALVVLLIAPILLSSKPVQALEWADLWENADQQGIKALESGDPEAAQALFKDQQWRGSAAYKSGDYKRAVDDFSGADNADGHYNRGNALAKAGDLDGAIEAYDHALKLQPDMADAQANRDLVEQLKQQQEKQSSDEQNNEDNQDKNQQQDESDRQDQKPSNQEPEQQDEQNGDPQQEPNKDQKPSDAEQESEQQKQKDAQEQQEKEQKEKEQKKKQQQAQETKEKQAQTPIKSELTDEEKQEQQEIEQMLRRVPDDPGGLLRAKFRYQSRQRALQQRQPKPPNDEERW